MNPEKEYAVNPGWGLVLTDAGISAANVLRRAGLPRDLFSRQSAALVPSQYYALWTAIEDEVGSANFPLAIARGITLEAFDPPLFAGACSPNLNVAARRIARHKKLMGPMRLEITQSAEETALTFVWPPDVDPPPSLRLFELVFWVAFPRLTTRALLRPLRVTTPRPPADAEPYRDYFGVRVRKGADNSVVYAAEDAARPFLTANDRMWEFFEPELRRRLDELEAGTSTRKRVRAALLELLPAGSGSMEAVADELAMSTRTLQRRLKKEGASFQGVLNDTRESLARHYLSNSHMSAGEISFLLGYEDPRSFYRAFHAWTGMTPQLARAAS